MTALDLTGTMHPTAMESERININIHTEDMDVIRNPYSVVRWHYDNFQLEEDLDVALHTSLPSTEEDANDTIPIFIYGFLGFIGFCVLVSVVKTIYAYLKTTVDSRENSNAESVERNPESSSIHQIDTSLIPRTFSNTNMFELNTLNMDPGTLRQSCNEVNVIQDISTETNLDMTLSTISDVANSRPSLSDCDTLWSSIDFDDLDESSVYRNSLQKIWSEENIFEKTSENLKNLAKLRELKRMYAKNSFASSEKYLRRTSSGYVPFASSSKQIAEIIVILEALVQKNQKSKLKLTASSVDGPRVSSSLDLMIPNTSTSTEFVNLKTVSAVPEYMEQRTELSSALMQQGHPRLTDSVVQNISSLSNSVRQDNSSSSNSVRQDNSSSSNSVRQDTSPSSKSVRQGASPSSKSVRQGASPSSKSVRQGASPSSKSVRQGASPSSKSMRQSTSPSSKSERQRTSPSSESVKQGTSHSSKSVRQGALLSSKFVRQCASLSLESVVQRNTPLSKSLRQGTSPSWESVKQGTSRTSESMVQGASPSSKSVRQGTSPSSESVKQGTSPSSKSVRQGASPSKSVRHGTSTSLESVVQRYTPLSKSVRQAPSPSSKSLSQVTSPSLESMVQMTIPSSVSVVQRTTSPSFSLEPRTSSSSETVNSKKSSDESLDSLSSSNTFSIYNTICNSNFDTSAYSFSLKSPPASETNSNNPQNNESVIWRTPTLNKEDTFRSVASADTDFMPRYRSVSFVNLHAASDFQPVMQKTHSVNFQNIKTQFSKSSMQSLQLSSSSTLKSISFTKMTSTDEIKWSTPLKHELFKHNDSA